MIRTQFSGVSDVGLARQRNEDCYKTDPQHQLYLVADGMGGHSHGEVAARLAVTTIQDLIARGLNGDSCLSLPDDQKYRPHSNYLRNAIYAAHDRVLQASGENQELEGMGTTVVGLLVRDGIAAVAHVGDSRAYRIRNGEIELLTQDHTWVNEQVVAGCLSEDQARNHPLRNVVTRALGGRKDIEVDLKELGVAGGDLFLLCSDGLTTMLTDAMIRERLTADKPLDEVCRSLVDEANARGGLDNITVVLLLVEAD